MQNKNMDSKDKVYVFIQLCTWDTNIKTESCVLLRKVKCKIKQNQF